MNLPDLPKKYNRKEAKIDGKVIDWFRNNYPYSCAIEVKVKSGKVKPHQEVALLEVNKGKFGYKIPDMGRRNPFDGFTLINAKAFVVTCDVNDCIAVEPDGKSFKFKI